MSHCIHQVLQLVVLLVAAASGAQRINPIGNNGFVTSKFHESANGNAVCVTGLVPVQAESTNSRFLSQLPSTQAEVTQTVLNFALNATAFLRSVADGTRDVGGTYNISSTLCLPADDTSVNTLHFLTHGVGFDHRYWDFAPGYSYVDEAISRGYATFSYDRLGVGHSSKEDPINTVQAPLQLAIAHGLIRKLRNGQLGNISFANVVGVGHSFGSVITQAVSANYPDSFDIVVLTGYSLDSRGSPIFFNALNLAIASEVQPYRFGKLDSGYLVASGPVSNQIGFFHSTGFDAELLSLADATKGTLTLAELLSAGDIGGVAAGFNGSVAVVNGQQDLPFCYGDCSSPTDLLSEVLKLYPRVDGKRFATHAVPHVGHALNLHYGALDAYEWIFDFLDQAQEV
jgi:pimeloyl-ACP methyl ester carboxylesterase